jgi:pyridoxine kinase
LNVLSIQSHVTYGHVGNDAAVFPMQRLGCEVWPIHTVQFSNHTGYGAWRGQVFNASLIDACVEGMSERGVLAGCDGILSGYMGAAPTGEAILRAVETVRAANPGALYCCDPVIGDIDGGIYVADGIPAFMRDRALKAADIMTPNQFELDYLTGCESRTIDGLRVALARAHELGPKIVLVTSLLTEETPADAIDLAASDGNSIWRVRTPRLDLAVNGAGDAMAALFFVHRLKGAPVASALASAAASIFGLLRRTVEAGSREILLVAAQDEFIAPTQWFEPEAI